MELPAMKQEKIKLAEINQYLTCYLCKGYLIDATTISECLHSFCRSCIIKFLQDNSYCPVCELIINKAKPNLKLDKTLQDIVYKLVPELFLKEMLRRKTFYKDYPQIAARVSPEERGEDTERTIFNPQEMISLSMEYICDDSTPGAIRIPGIATDSETLKSNGGSAEDSRESQMKRYLLCPGMCRIEVLKKFVRNKYNVDTSQFFIDLLYKRVPLPDHYTLIDIAYIYSWQRNELMKFFFRIIDRNKNWTDSPENNAPKYLPTHFRKNKINGEKTSATPKRKESASDRKSQRKSVGKINNSASKHSSQDKIRKEIKVCDRKSTKIKSENEVNNELVSKNSDLNLASNNTKTGRLEKHLNKTIKSEPCKELHINKETNKTEQGLKGERCKNKLDKENESETGIEALKVKVHATDKESAVDSDNKLYKVHIKDCKVPKDKICDPHKDKIIITKTEKKVCKTKENSNNMVHIQPSHDVKDRVIKAEQFKTEIKNELPIIPFIKKEPLCPETQSEKTEGRLILKVSKDLLGEPNIITSKAQNFTKPITKSYTSITLNRSENVEIITKIEPVSNKDGQPIGHHIIKQTIKKGQKLKSNSPKKVSGKVGQVTIPRLLISKKTVKKRTSPKRTINIVASGNQPRDSTKEAAPANEALKNENQQSVHNRLPLNTVANLDDEKSKFLKCVELTPTTSLQVNSEKGPPSVQLSQPPKKQLIISRSTGGQKRKSTSPIKNSKAKVSKLESKKPVKIILHERPNPSKTNTLSSGAQADIKRDNGLQSLINSCKIPSSLSITIKESSDKDSLPHIAPPVKNFIEILKLPDESSCSTDKEKAQSSDNMPKELTQLEISQFCDNDSEQKVDQDLSEIAKSLTEKIPMSTTVSQIVGPKQQFQIPVKTNIPQQFQIQPAPVPEVSKAVNIAVPPNESLAKLNPRSPQTFQKIFEESLKKTPESPKTSTVEVVSNDSNTTHSPSKRNILEIASQLVKKTKLEQDQSQSDVKKEEVALPKVPIPRLPNPRTTKSVLKKFEPDQINKLVPQTVASLHSSSLGMNYTVSVSQQSPSKTTKVNCIVSPVKAESVPKVPECKPSVSPLNELKSITADFKVPSPSLGSPKLPEVSSASASSSPRPKTPSPKHSPKSSPLVKHMYAPTVPVFNQKVLSPMNRFASLSPKPSRSLNTSPRLPSLAPKPPNISPNPTPLTKTSPASPSSSILNGNSSSLSPNEILEKYNIQNLAQLSASFNLNPSVVANNQLAAFQHAMLLKHFEMQNRHNWLNRNQGPLLQYEKYLQSLNGGLNGSQSNL